MCWSHVARAWPAATGFCRNSSYIVWWVSRTKYEDWANIELDICPKQAEAHSKYKR